MIVRFLVSFSCCFFSLVSFSNRLTFHFIACNLYSVYVLYVHSFICMGDGVFWHPAALSTHFTVQFHYVSALWLIKFSSLPLSLLIVCCLLGSGVFSSICLCAVHFLLFCL